MPMHAGFFICKVLQGSSFGIPFCPSTSAYHVAPTNTIQPYEVAEALKVRRHLTKAARCRTRHAMPRKEEEKQKQDCRQKSVCPGFEAHARKYLPTHAKQGVMYGLPNTCTQRPKAATAPFRGHSQGLHLQPRPTGNKGLLGDDVP